MSQTMREALERARQALEHCLNWLPDDGSAAIEAQNVISEIVGLRSAPSSEQQGAEPSDGEIIRLAGECFSDENFEFTGELMEFARGIIALASRPAAAAQGAPALPLTCRHSNRSDCALFGTDATPPVQRPSREWYAKMIAETEGMDDMLPMGALAAAPAVGVTALRIAVDALEILNRRPRPMCRDCADENGTCPGSGLPCDMVAVIRDARAALAGAAQGAEPSALRGALEEIAAMEYDKWSNGARAGEIARNALAMQSQSIPVTGATVADRLDAMADREQAGSQASSDLYAAATVWRKHLKAGAAQGADTRDDLLAQMRAYVNLIKGAALQGPSFFTEERCRNLFEECVRLNGAYLSLPAAQGVEPAGHVCFVAHRKAPDVEWATNVEIRNGAPLYLGAQPAAQGAELVVDEIANTLMNGVERYRFECEGGALENCVHWQALRDHANGQQVAAALIDPEGHAAACRAFRTTSPQPPTGTEKKA